MKKYIRTIDGRFFIDPKEDVELHQGKKTVSSSINWCFTANIIVQSDDILDLLLPGDLISFTTSLGTETRVFETHLDVTSLLVDIKHGETKINSIYTKQNLFGKSCYVLVWDKERGII